MYPVREDTGWHRALQLPHVAVVDILFAKIGPFLPHPGKYFVQPASSHCSLQVPDMPRRARTETKCGETILSPQVYPLSPGLQVKPTSQTTASVGVQPMTSGVYT